MRYPIFDRSSPSLFQLGGWILSTTVFLAGGPLQAARQVLSLNGQWELAESVEADASGTYERKVPVPGLVDLAAPGLVAVGVESPQRNYFWYRTTFETPGTAFDRAQLIIHKAKYGTKVWLNGGTVGEHDFNFSAGEFEVDGALAPAGERNELVVRVAAHPSLQAEHIVWGHDFEKNRHIPGIYDDVEIVFTGAGRFGAVQLVPSWAQRSVGVAVELDGAKAATSLSYRVTEAASGLVVAGGQRTVAADGERFEIGLPDGQPWSPESPFLYQMELWTDDDSWSHRFGLRDFAFNPDTGFAELNGQTYFLRGTNICLFRFFEDSQRGAKPWDRAWVRTLFERMKEMKWNSFRFCLGPAPRWWYDLCDEMGFLVQDEFPIWYGAEAATYPAAFTAEALVPQYADWMSERWNHSSIVIWDAQNESVTAETGKAIRRVRGIDLSDRPWDNGYSPPQRATDPIEAHPYVLQNFLGRDPGPQGPLYEFMRERRIPDNGPSELYPPEGGGIYPNPIQNNENVFFWITREGAPTALTRWIFTRMFPEDTTADEYYRAYGYMYHRLISYWRVHRTSATVQEFCVLGYSRGIEDEGYTADNFVDLDTLTFKPHYRDYAYAAFYPIGLLMNRWEEIHSPGKQLQLPVLMCNDLNQPWAGSVMLRLIDATGAVMWEGERSTSLSPLGTIDVPLPETFGDYVLEASYQHDGETIRHEYRFTIGDEPVIEPAPETPKENDQFIHVEDSGILEVTE